MSMEQWLIVARARLREARAQGEPDYVISAIEGNVRYLEMVLQVSKED